jgi:hypothetical protein
MSAASSLEAVVVSIFNTWVLFPPPRKVESAPAQVTVRLRLSVGPYVNVVPPVPNVPAAMLIVSSSPLLFAAVRASCSSVLFVTSKTAVTPLTGKKKVVASATNPKEIKSKCNKTLLTLFL